MGTGIRMRKIFWAAMAGVGGVGLILLTPFLLMAVGPEDADWAKLSQINQAYGALSVILSAGAVAGVAASLAYQARQTRIATEETTWSAHRELLLLALAKTVSYVARRSLVRAWGGVRGVGLFRTACGRSRSR
jgi:hypothetical protein